MSIKVSRRWLFEDLYYCHHAFIAHTGQIWIWINLDIAINYLYKVGMVETLVNDELVIIHHVFLYSPLHI